VAISEMIPYAMAIVAFSTISSPDLNQLIQRLADLKLQNSGPSLEP
jgi:hypothetical protein